MISSHFPADFAARWSWVIAALALVIGALAATDVMGEQAWRKAG